MRADLHAQHFNKEQFSSLLLYSAGTLKRFKPRNKRHLDFALTELHSSCIYCAK